MSLGEDYDIVTLQMTQSIEPLTQCYIPDDLNLREYSYLFSDLHNTLNKWEHSIQSGTKYVWS